MAEPEPEPGGSTTASSTKGVDSSKNLVEVMTKTETETALAKKQDNITVSASAPTSSDGADGDIWLTYGADSGTLPENVLTQAQLDAANSGITASKVTAYDGYSTTIAGKQDKLTAGSNITISSDNVISATGGGGTAGVTSFNTKTGAITQAIDTLTAFTATSSQLRLNKTRYNADGTSKADYVSVPVVTDSSYGVVSPSMKQKWDAKADASTVTQIQTAVGGCFNDASISGNNLVLGTVGGQQNTLTLPGGSSGGLNVSEIEWNDLKDYLSETYTRNNIHSLAVITSIEPIIIKIDIDGSLPTWNTSITNVIFSGSANLTSYRFCGMSNTKNTDTKYLYFTISAGSTIKYDYRLCIPLTPDAWDIANTNKGIQCDILAYNAAEIKSYTQYFSPSAFIFYKITN